MNNDNFFESNFNLKNVIKYWNVLTTIYFSWTIAFKVILFSNKQMVKIFSETKYILNKTVLLKNWLL